MQLQKQNNPHIYSKLNKNALILHQTLAMKVRQRKEKPLRNEQLQY